VKSRSLLVLALFALTGCGAYGRSAVRVAALDHGCEESRVTLLEQDGTTAVLEVCGRRRVYRDTAGATNPATWTDVTLTTEDCGGGESAPVVEEAPAPEPVSEQPVAAPTPEPVAPAPAPAPTP
jgi:hypothetical protein